MATTFRHLNRNEREYLYPIIAESQGGAFCNHCGATRRSLEANEKDSTLIVDRMDNHQGYWIQDRKTGDKKPRLDNLQLVCRGCNKSKEYDRPAITERPMTPEMVVNMSKEPFFRKWVRGKIESSKGHRLEYEEAVDSGAEFIGISVETAKRYIRKLISKSGGYELGWGQNGGTYIYEKGNNPFVTPYEPDTSEN